ncbi:unnamed protein product [Candidula unifasciata]|uniref:FADD n=1 Tax=Candidula unifasciata TaxID=100452 RepID=A0A8S3Z0W8_9EUPU|nr:unnamed protein product [Candidula unifasciata]
MEDSRRHKQMIIKLGRLIKTDELNTLKFLCKDIIPAKLREKITTTEALFEALEERRKVLPGDQTFLRELLQDGLQGRVDVLEVVEEYERGGLCSPDVDSVRFSGLQIEDFTQEVQFLKDNIGREYKSFLRRLGVKECHIDQKEIEYPRNIQEIIHQCIRQWIHDHRDWQRDQVLEAVVKVLRKERRNDLAATFEAREF